MTKKSTVKTEAQPDYIVQAGQPAEDQVIAEALRILRGRLAKPGIAVSSPSVAEEFLTLQLAARPYESFSAMWLDNRHRVIAFEELFRGTIDNATVYPREVVRQAMTHNAAAVILAHNHPSGMAEPSDADRLITARLKTALEYLDVRVLDHIVVGSTGCVSMASRGLL